jgi:hypothetical protein
VLTRLLQRHPVTSMRASGGRVMCSQICEAFNANRYPFPEDPARQRQMHGEVRAGCMRVGCMPVPRPRVHGSARAAPVRCRLLLTRMPVVPLRAR